MIRAVSIDHRVNPHMVYAGANESPNQFGVVSPDSFTLAQLNNPKLTFSTRKASIAKVNNQSPSPSPNQKLARFGTVSRVDSVQNKPDFKISLSKTDRAPTLPEKIEIVDKWFRSMTIGLNYKTAEVSIKDIADLFVSKQLASDKDTGIKIVLKSLNIRQQDSEVVRINYALFQRIFCRCVFKESLVEVLREIEGGDYRTR